ncbi:MAG: Bax inhibitor-1/YccA family protein [Candidatus Omnitrophica bacterium]|nr:Bax inhibitor-1/YccA family protein [Candidatus Omnitrophota bacterium]
MRRSSNPTLNPAVFSKLQAAEGDGVMTVQGAVNKVFALLFLVMITASWSWGKIFQPASTLGLNQEGVPISSTSMGLVMVCAIVGFIIALITIFKKQWSPLTAPGYALCEGIVLGGFSAIFEMQYPGIVLQAVCLTFGVLFSLLLIYKSGLIKVTEKFRMGVVAATAGIAVVYILNFVLGFFGIQLPFIYGANTFGIVFSLFVVGIASLNLVLDFDFIDQGAAHRLPRYMEWYSAFGIMVTLIWLYIEILRLLSKLRRR